MSKRLWIVLIIGCGFGSAWWPARAAAAPAEALQRLWTIGRDDHQNAEFSLAPRGYAEFQHDGFFVVGQSDPATDWPYVHPGPDDSWAGGHSHTFAVVFALRSVPDSQLSRLVIDLLDTQGAVPPKVRIDVNGRVFEHQTPRGKGDVTVYGAPEQGREHRIEIELPAGTLRVGNNHVSITSLSGSWMLYDWLGLDVPPSVQLGEAAGTIVRSVQAAPMLIDCNGVLTQTVQLEVIHVGQPTRVTVHLSGAEPVQHQLQAGSNTLELPVPNVSSPTEAQVIVKTDQGQESEHTITLKPVRKWVVYLLPHSHVDIGYTHVQTDVERSHWQFYEQALAAARQTADYPPEARFKWNVEVLWATDSYLKQASPAQRDAFLDAVKQGFVGLDALYGNQLTGLCRPEELIQLVDYGNRLKREHDVPIESAMISDVPGYTWGIVSVLAESGVKYFSIGPNNGHRIGFTLRAYGDKPFWWRSPGGRHRILCWIPGTGYWQGFRGAAGLQKLLQQMEDANYPYELVQIRHCLGDNAGPGVDLSQFVRDWNAKYAYPKLVIATTREAMRELERRYGDRLPELSGDFTPYWEDGAGSSARETALNRAAAERLVQAETLFALLQPTQYPLDAFREAWRNVVLYDEHTWGAHCSITEPESDFTKAQWAIKQRFALDADAQSTRLLGAATTATQPASEPVRGIDVWNTCSWTRTDVVRVPGAWSAAGDCVRDAQGDAVPAQRLHSGELAFLAADVPALGAARFTVHPRTAAPADQTSQPHAVQAAGNALTNGSLDVQLDAERGAIQSLRWRNHDFVDAGSPGDPLVNDYLYVAGRRPDQPQSNGSVDIDIREQGPLVASIVVRSAAPGCTALERELTLYAGLDRLDIANLVDKQNVYQQEAVHFAFPFQVPEGVIRMDIPWAVARVETDQLPGACKNYFTVQRWVDVANDNLGITLATVDAPLVEVGRITCDPIAVGWIERLEPTQTFFSYVMNNYWETNYKASQDGPTLFRYSLRPHAAYDPASTARFGVARSQPLIVLPAGAAPLPSAAPIQIDSDAVMATSVRPGAAAGALVVRLFNPTDQPASASIRCPDSRSTRTQLCDLTGFPVGELAQPIQLDPYQFVTVHVSK
jgi:hypothetical protein